MQAIGSSRQQQPLFREEQPVSKTEIQTAIDEHHQSVEGIRYQFKVVWAALEPRWSSRSRRYAVAIDVRSAARVGSRTIHIMARASTTRADLLRLVDDALEHLVCESRDSAAGLPAEQTPEMLRA